MIWLQLEEMQEARLGENSYVSIEVKSSSTGGAYS